jgi:RimJ/RimL family protein N-acetyltransferase
MTLASRTRWSVRRYWADRLGVSVDAFEGSGVTVGVATEGGVQVFRCGESVVVGAPAEMVAVVRERAGSLADAEREDDVAGWLEGFDPVEGVLGPTFYGYADRESFSPVESDARVLRADDEGAFESLRVAVPEQEWEHGGPAFTPGETVGVFEDGSLVAVSGFAVWDDLLAHLAVVAHPAHRGEGHGQAVVSRAAERAFTAGYVPQYRTADAWPWSVALAERLGFERFATAFLGRCDA